ncbi:MAG: integrase domain-containing protein [Sterolibacterium sp.]
MGARSIQKEIELINRHTGGATLTVIARATALMHTFNVWRNDLNLQIKSLVSVKTSQIAAYVKHEQDAGKSIRSIQNDLAHIRAGLRAVGREQFAKSAQISNKSLGASGASRDGTHKALTAEQYLKALADARERNSGVAAAMELQRELGLRAREAVQSVQSLERWEKSLLRGESIRVIHGTKGGHPRDTGPINHERALKAVRDALEVARINGGQIIQSRSLQGAMRAYGRHLKALGLTEEFASHALRCTYAQDRFLQHLEATGGDRREALAETSLDLGHGDGRGTYVKQVYLRS